VAVNGEIARTKKTREVSLFLEAKKNRISSLSPRS
jgi:hypothetical protein